MKNYANGSWIALKKHGLFIVSLSFLLLAPKGWSLTRRDWIFTQLSSTSLPLRNPGLGFQLGVSTLSYDSRLSTQASLFWDSKWFEVGMRASGRVLGSLGSGRTQVTNSLKEWNETYSIEIARRFLSPEGRYGRIGLQLDEFSPNRERFFHVAMDTGILESPSEPGSLKLSFHFFRPLDKDSDTRLTSTIDVGHVFSRWSLETLNAGLAFGWIYHLSKEQTEDYQSEHMIFSASPWLEYTTPAFHARLSIPLRLFLDKQWQDKGVLVTGYPMELASPDIYASLFFLL